MTKHLTTVFQDNPGKAVPERLHSGVYWSKDDGSGGDNTGDVQSSSQTVNINKPTPSFLQTRMPFLLPNQQCQSTEGKLSVSK